MDFEAGLPIYLQIVRLVKQRIASGEWPPGMRIPPVRELSVDMGVNPNTAQRALAELERDGLVYAERTSGRFITDDAELIARVRAEMAAAYADGFIAQMRSIGFDGGGILGLVERRLDEKHEGKA